MGTRVGVAVAKGVMVGASVGTVVGVCVGVGVGTGGIRGRGAGRQVATTLQYRESRLMEPGHFECDLNDVFVVVRVDPHQKIFRIVRQKGGYKTL